MRTATATRSESAIKPSERSAISREKAAKRMYDAEVALHHARQTHVDAWIAAAYERLHEAIEVHIAAVETTESDVANRR
jgi:hypothetical protein